MNKILKFNSKDAKTGKVKSVGQMEVKNKTDDFAELYFYGDIVSSSWGVWEKEDKCPQDVADFLNEVKNVKNLNMYINSGGGSVFAGLAIYNQIKRFSAYKTVHVDGLAASISSVIALSGDKIIIPSTAQFMIHEPWTWAMGSARQLRDAADSMDKIEISIINVYKENLKDGVDIETIINMIHTEPYEAWMTGEEASQYFNIEVSDEAKVVACASQYFSQYHSTPESLLIPNNTEKNKANNILLENTQKARKLKIELDLL